MTSPTLMAGSPMSAASHVVLDLPAQMNAMGSAARAAAQALALASTQAKNVALRAMAASLRSNRETLLSANKLDMQQATERGLSAAMLDRLMLDDKRIE